MKRRNMSDLTVPVFGRNLRGRPLRRLLTTLLADAARSMTLDELSSACAIRGVWWGDDRPSKVISDALRWEIEWGRVRRVGRGKYEFGGAPPTTLRRIREQAAVIVALLADADDVIRLAARDPAWQWELRAEFGEPNFRPSPLE